MFADAINYGRRAIEAHETGCWDNFAYLATLALGTANHEYDKIDNAIAWLKCNKCGATWGNAEPGRDASLVAHQLVGFIHSECGGRVFLAGRKMIYNHSIWRGNYLYGDFSHHPTLRTQ